MVKSARKSETETFGIVRRFHRFEDLLGKRVFIPILNIQKKKKQKQNKTKQKNLHLGRKETELNQNRQEQVWRMKYLLTEVKWMNIKVKINS